MLGSVHIGEGVRAQYGSHGGGPLDGNKFVFAQQNLAHVIRAHHANGGITEKVRFVDISILLAFHPQEFPPLESEAKEETRHARIQLITGVMQYG